MVSVIGILEFLDSGRKSWTLDSGRWILDAILRTVDAGPWILDAGRWPLGSEPSTQDVGLWTLNARLWTLKF